ncbi:hypothetical protein GGR54DRAFT_132790 [Hypoxylon sp. NC1633]|nr:hypothetical protein GGR54DRAFT_132790 [Hypoxylon sp. NC1633]
MERKDEDMQTSQKQEGGEATTQAIHPPVTSQHVPEATEVLTLHRPWANREHTLNGSLQKEDWWKAKGSGGGLLERWTDQPMTDDPYQNVNSVTTNTSEQSSPSGSQPTKDEVTLSETAATSGSGQITPGST